MTTNPTRLLINLDRCPNRLANSLNVFRSQNISFERITAVDAQSIDAKIIQKIKSTYNPYLPKELTPGEIACFLSHMKCWEIIVKRGIRGAFVFEDDIALSKTGAPLLATDNWIPENVDVCQLGTWSPTPHTIKFRKILRINNQFVITRINTRSAVLGSQGYWISLRAAKKALKLATKNLCGPVDNFLFDPKFDIPHSLSVWTLSPAIVFPERAFCSTLESERSQKEDTPVSFKNKIKIFWRKKTGKLFTKTLVRQIAK